MTEMIIKVNSVKSSYSREDDTQHKQISDGCFKLKLHIEFIYFRGRNFREQKLSRISRILAKFAKVNVTKFFKDIDSQKFMNAKNIFFLKSRKKN